MTLILPWNESLHQTWHATNAPSRSVPRSPWRASSGTRPTTTGSGLDLIDQRPRGLTLVLRRRSQANALATVFLAMPNRRAIAACESFSALCSRRISAQSSNVIAPQAVLGMLRLHPSTTAQFSRVVDTFRSGSWTLQILEGLDLYPALATPSVASTLTTLNWEEPSNP